MKAYVLTKDKLMTTKEELKRLKKERAGLYRRINRERRRHDDYVELDIIEGRISGMEFVLNVIIEKE